MPDSPVFLERQSYRMRRLMDAVRLLPFVGLALWMVPLMWPVPDVEATNGGIPMSTALRYLFGVWLLMVTLGWLMWRKTKVQGVSRPPDTRDAP